MKTFKENWLILIFFILFIGAFFYWFELRQNIIRKDCSVNALGRVRDMREEFGEKDGLQTTHADYENYYIRCIREHGLNK